MTLTQRDADSAMALRQAIDAARRGDGAAARTIARDALTAGGDAVALNAFLGMIEARDGDLAAALPHLAEAHRLRPDDITIALNHVAALTDHGALDEAFAAATPALCERDSSLRLMRYRGFTAQQTGRFDEAVFAYEKVVAAHPGDFESWNNLGNARTELGDAEGAVAALRQALAIDPDAPPTRLNLASALRHAGQAEAAEQELRDAARDFPGDARPWHELYVNAKRDWDTTKALEALQQAVALDLDNAGLQFKMAVEMGILHRADEAEQAFGRALTLDPLLNDAYLGLAIHYEHNNREHMFAPLIARAETNGLPEGSLAFLRALEHRRAGRFAEGLAAISSVAPGIEPQRVAHTRATLLDRLGRSDEAFAAFAEANALHAASSSDPLARAATLRDQLKAQIPRMTPEWRAGWQSAPAVDGRPSPCFLVGFPRSGTTLLDTIMMGHPNCTVMEEQPPLNFVDERLGGLDSLAALNAEQIKAARDQYFEEVSKVSAWQPGTLLVDKSPLFLHKAALIQRLFPDARIILALRHPCDVVLSCFMSNFRLNSAMANFLRIDDAASFYDITFRHWEAARAVLPLDVTLVRYEQLVSDVEGTIRPLFDHLGLDWQAKALDHSRTARSRGLIKTASYAQVTEPIYQRAAGRWQRYREHLAPVLPVLRPWIEHFGYEI